MSSYSAISETSISESPEEQVANFQNPKNVVRPKLSRIVFAMVLETKQK